MRAFAVAAGILLVCLIVPEASAGLPYCERETSLGAGALPMRCTGLPLDRAPLATASPSSSSDQADCVVTSSGVVCSTT